MTSGGRPDRSELVNPTKNGLYGPGGTAELLNPPVPPKRLYPPSRLDDAAYPTEAKELAEAILLLDASDPRVKRCLRAIARVQPKWVDPALVNDLPDGDGKQLVVADELFFAGTATEVMPIRSLDRITIGADGRRGPITERIQSAFHDIVHGRVPDRFGWLSPVDS
mgnify:CR=1 FL=1